MKYFSQNRIMLYLDSDEGLRPMICPFFRVPRHTRNCLSGVIIRNCRWQLDGQLLDREKHTGSSQRRLRELLTTEKMIINLSVRLLVSIAGESLEGSLL